MGRVALCTSSVWIRRVGLPASAGVGVELEDVGADDGAVVGGADVAAGVVDDGPADGVLDGGHVGCGDGVAGEEVEDDV